MIFIWHIAGSAVRGFSNAQLSEHYANCMKLSVENKINVKNAFHLQLIDYMTEMMRKKASDMDNFQVRSITPCFLFNLTYDLWCVVVIIPSSKLQQLQSLNI